MDIGKEGLIHAYSTHSGYTQVPFFFLFKGALSFHFVSFFSKLSVPQFSLVFIMALMVELWAHVFVYSYIDFRFRFRQRLDIKYRWYLIRIKILS